MKINNKYVRYTIYALISLAAISIIAFSSIVAYIHHDTKQKQEASAKEKEEKTTESEDMIDTSATNEVSESEISVDQRQTYISFYPVLKEHLELYDKAWKELWQPSINLIYENPSVALETLIMLSTSYESQAKKMRDLSLPVELPTEDAQKFSEAAEYFASAMDLRQKEAFFAAAAAKNGTFEEQATIDYIKECADRADDYFVEGANLIVELNEKYDFIP